jgi:hypothetical protein
MCQPWRPNNIARSVNSFVVRLIAIVGLNVATVGQAEFQLSPGQKRRHANRDKCYFRLDRFG